MRELLRDYPEGVPTDTLLARIRGRRSFLVAAWDSLLLAAEPLDELPPAPWRPDRDHEGGGVWRALQREYVWVFRWMNEPLRVVTAPFFVLAELRTVALCLRSLAGGREGTPELLRDSLLNRGIREALLTSPTADRAVRRLAPLLSPHAPSCAGLGELLQREGYGALDAGLRDAFLEGLAGFRLHPVLGRFIAHTIDGCNLVAVAKGIRWRSAGRPRLLPGGGIPLPQLEELSDRHDLAGVARRAALLGGRWGKEIPGEVELAVLHSQYLAVRGMAREPSGVGAIVDYLWRCRNEARTIGLFSRLATVGPAAVEAEIVS